MANKKGSSTKTPIGNSLFEHSANLNVIQATFCGQKNTSFDELLEGYNSLKVLTYSNSVSIINRTASKVEDIEIIFGREDIVNEMAQYLHYQELLLKELIAEVKGEDFIRKKIEAGKIRLFVVKDIISHEKLFLLQGENCTRVITGSANFSEKAFSGNQNESYICFDNDPLAWSYFTDKYNRIKTNSTMTITQKAILDEGFDLENIPAFTAVKEDNNHSTFPQIIIVQDKPPEANIIQKIISQKTPKQYTGLNTILKAEHGVVRIDRRAVSRAIQYIKSNARTETENTQEYLSIYPDAGQVILSGKAIQLDAPNEEIQSAVNIIIEYFAGYNEFRGDVEKLTKDYFMFMSWFYISPFLCDFRNRALANDEYIQDYPIFGILYGKSNCGKSELIRTLLISMFQREGFLQNEWFTKTNVAGLREQNKRFPMVFDDLDAERFTNHAVALIKEDFISLKEYPIVVLSMNKDKDSFATEIRKRCLIIYTGASLPDDTPASRTLAKNIKRLRRDLTDALYREYLKRVLHKLQTERPIDILEFSSRIICEIFREYYTKPLPGWCQPTSINEYTRTKHDKVRDELYQLWKHNPSAWTEEQDKFILKLDDIHSARKLLKDIPDYLIKSGSRGDVIIFEKNDLEEFLGISMKGGLIESFKARFGRFLKRKEK